LLIDRGTNVWARNSQRKTPVDLDASLDLTVPWKSLQGQ